MSGSTLDIVSFADVEERRIRWLWKDWIPEGMLTILGGYGGDGKSTVMAAIAAALSSGSPLPDGTTREPMNTLLLSAEDDPATAIKPRLVDHGADVSRVLALRGTRVDGASRWFDLGRDVPRMEEAIRAHDIRLVVIDPLSAYLPKVDLNNEGAARDALQPVVSMVERTGVAVVCIMHIGKSSENRRAAQKLLGSTAFTALARSVIMLSDLPQDQQPEDWETGGKIKVIQVVKSNYAIAPPPLRFRRPIDQPLNWLGRSAVTVEACLNGTSATVPDADERLRAADFLKEMLASGPMPTQEVVTQGKEEGFSESTLRRALKMLDGGSRRQPGTGQWNWSLPGQEPSPTQETLAS